MQSLDLNYIEKVLLIILKHNCTQWNVYWKHWIKTALLDPKKPMDKGFGLIMSKDKQIINSIDKVAINQEIKLVLKDGEIETIIKGVKKMENKTYDQLITELKEETLKLSSSEISMEQAMKIFEIKH